MKDIKGVQIGASEELFGLYVLFIYKIIIRVQLQDRYEIIRYELGQFS